MPEADTPDFETAAQTAQESLTSSNPELPEKIDTPVTAEETKEDNPETLKEEVEEFTAVKFDDLPEQLKGTYKSLQADYTRKRQKETSEIKELRAEVERLRQYGVETKNPTLRQPLPPSPINPIEQMIDRKIEAQKIEEAYQKEVAYVEGAQKEFVALDERLNSELPSYDPYMAHAIEHSLATLRGEYEQKNGTVIGFDFIGQAKQLIEGWGKYLENINKGFVARQNEIARSSAQKSQVQNPKKTPADAKKSGSMTIEEAMEAALADQS